MGSYEAVSLLISFRLRIWGSRVRILPGAPLLSSKNNMLLTM